MNEIIIKTQKQFNKLPFEFSEFTKIILDADLLSVYKTPIKGSFVIYSGTIESVGGGTIESIYGGTIQYVYGGTIKSVRGGTIEYVYGNTAINLYSKSK